MYKTYSYNVIFVYSLLVIDLVVNIADNLLSPAKIQRDGSRPSELGNLAFFIVIVQIFAIVCVIVDLVVHFLGASERVRQFVWMQMCLRNGDRSRCKVGPMPLRCALKLVLDKYWWSLLVGVFYLILTIILQLIRLDPSWHYQAANAKLWMNSADAEEPTMTEDSLRLMGSETVIDPAPGRGDHLASGFTSWLPIVVLLVHKLMSTCYYVSFVVVYRATPNQIVNRIFVNKTALRQIRTNSSSVT